MTNTDLAKTRDRILADLRRPMPVPDEIPRDPVHSARLTRCVNVAASLLELTAVDPCVSVEVIPYIGSNPDRNFLAIQFIFDDDRS